MWADGVVKGFNIGEEISLSSAAGIIPPQVNQLAFQAAEKVFGHGVVVRVALAGQALTDAKGSQPVTEGRGGILAAPVAMEDQPRAGPLTAYGHVQRSQSQLSINAAGKGIAYHLFGI